MNMISINKNDIAEFFRSIVCKSAIKDEKLKINAFVPDEPFLPNDNRVKVDISFYDPVIERKGQPTESARNNRTSKIIRFQYSQEFLEDCGNDIIGSTPEDAILSLLNTFDFSHSATPELVNRDVFVIRHDGQIKPQVTS